VNVFFSGKSPSIRPTISHFSFESLQLSTPLVDCLSNLGYSVPGQE
jgi:hypothetical protein